MIQIFDDDILIRDMIWAKNDRTQLNDKAEPDKIVTAVSLLFTSECGSICVSEWPERHEARRRGLTRTAAR